MDPDGAVVAFAKVATNGIAIGELGREAITLEWLAGTGMSDRVPRIIDRFGWSGSSVLLTAPGPRGRGPRRPGSIHTEFLSQLAASTGCRTTYPDSATGRALGAALPAGGVSTSDVYDRLDRAHRYLSERLSGARLPGVLAHHDFVPWNTRCDDRGLWVLDWEAAEREDLPLMDANHLTFAPAALLGKSESRGWFGKVLEAQPEVVRHFSGELRVAYLAGVVLRFSGNSPSSARDKSPIIERACGELDRTLSGFLGPSA